MAFTQDLFSSYRGYDDGNTRIGDTNRIWYDSNTNTLRIGDGSTPGGIIITGGSSGSYTLPIATSSSLGGVEIGNNINIDVNGKISVDFTGIATETWVNNLFANYNDLGDLYIDTNPTPSTAIQSIFGSINNADIVISPKGSGLFANYGMRVLDLLHPDEMVGSIIKGSGSIVANISNVYIAAITDNGDVAELVPPIYGLTNGITGVPYTVYQLTTIPNPILQNGDIIGGAAIPVGSTIIHQGTDDTGKYFIITDRNFPSGQSARPYADLTNGQPGHTSVATTVARDTTNAGLSITTIDNTDITLNSGPGGKIVVHSDIIPFTNGVWNLGSPNNRFKEIWFGTGTIYLQDETLGNDQAIGARDGNLYIAGGAGLIVGEFTLRDNKIRITDPTRDIEIGITTATGRVLFNRPIAVNSPAGQITFKVDRVGLTTINTPSSITTTQSALTITGNTAGYVRERNFPDTLLTMAGKDGVATRVNMDSFGSGAYSVIAARQANGTALNPSATVNNDTLLRISTQGWGTTGYISTIGRINIQAAQNFTDTQAGTRVRFQTTPNDSVTIQPITADITSIGLSFVGNATGGITFRDSTRQITAPTIIPSQSGYIGYYLRTDGVAGGTDINGNTTTGTLSWAPIPQSIVYKGTWNATNNTPVITQTTAGGVTAQAGWEYSISSSGTRDIGSGSKSYDQGGFIIYNGTEWEYITPVSGVSSIQFDGIDAYTGVVHVQSSDITNTLDIGSITNSKLAYSSITVTAGTGMSGGGVVSLGGSITLNNNGVTSISAGSGIVVSGTNNVTISSTGVISVTGTNHISTSTLNGVVTVTSDATSASTANTIALRDNTGGLDAGNFTATQNVSILSNHGAFNYGVLSYSDTGIMADFSSSANSYNQIILQNTSSGSNSSTNYIVSNNYGTASTFYGEFGMNSSSFTSDGNSLTLPNAVYLNSISSDLVIGGDHIHFVVNGIAADVVDIDETGTATFANQIVGSISGSSNNVRHSVTFATAGGASANSTFDGSSAITVDYHTVGAQVAGTYITGVSGSSPISSTGGTTPTISISQSNGTTNGYLSSTDWNTFNNKITSVSGTAPINVTSGTTPTVSISQASSTSNGYLSSTDWNTFNSKTNNTGTVTSIATSGNVSGITLTGGTITTTGTITLGGTIDKASSSTFGIAKVDGTTITASGGVISANTYTGYGNGTLYYALNSSRTIGNTTANTMYSIFGVGATVTANTRYEFELVFTANGPSGKQSLFTFSGEATPTRISIYADSTNSANNTPVLVYEMITSNFTTTLFNICSSANVQGTEYSHRITGMIDIGATGGTIIPNIGFTTNGTAVTVNPQSWIRLTPLGAIGANTVAGTWI